MHSSLIGKIEKARRYAEERDRAQFSSFAVDFRGGHNQHQVTYKDDTWSCSCQFFLAHGVCSHTMALERILEGMLPAAALAQRPL